MPHCPPEHAADPLAGTGQAWPHVPQFAAFVAVSTQLPEQGTRPPLHVAAHAPPEHASPLAQAVAHFPQFAGSTDVSAHASLHCARPELHAKPQVLALQEAVANAGTLQTPSQLPQ